MSIPNGLRSILISMFVALFCWSFSQTAYAEVTPYSGEVLRTQAEVIGTACGLVETTWDDPDWAMVTSDHILRSHDCIAECASCPTCWYNQPFDPCYSTNRYWKFQENSGTAFAFPMAALGVGTFDGLYLRRNVKFQLYSGSDESNPFGPEMRGPIYISIDCWRDVYVACEGFEPGTFFVTGGPGALANYSMKIGGDTDIESVDIKRSDNMIAHHTNKFNDNFVLRRGATFEVEVRFGQEYGPGCHEVYFEATHNFDGIEKIVDIPPYDTAPPAGEWGAEYVGAETNGDNTRSVTVKVHIPADAAIGEYEFKAFVRNKDTTDPTDEQEFEDTVIIIFNPWGVDDDVYMSGTAQLQEYVLNENGKIWRGEASSNSPKSWRFDQFDEKTIEVAMYLLEGLSSSNRADPKAISRYFSKMTNSQDDNGIVVGCWGCDTSGGKLPSYWSGSDQIISRYAASKTPVRYGQCWVFGGVLTSLLRCVGIPARPLTNFESAHDRDKPVNKAVDFYFDTMGNYDRSRTKDSKWNYHVWCDAWINEWNAVDGTPQETSDGVYQTGPAPHVLIKNDLGGLYDVDFVFAEVDAVINYWIALADGTDFLINTNTTRIGRNITTKAVSGNGASDITSAYKTPETTALARMLAAASDVDVTVDVPEIIVLGSNIVWTVQLANNSGSIRKAHVIIGASAIDYDGSLISPIDNMDTEIDIGPGEVEKVTLTIPASSYIAWTNTTRTFEAAVSVVIAETNDILLDVQRTVLIASGPVITLSSNLPIPEGGSVNLAADWSNPLSTELSNVLVIFSVGEGLSISGASNVEVPVGNLAAGQQLSVFCDISAMSKGIHYATVTISADKISDIFADQAITVLADCNGNGVADSIDIEQGFSNDCNGNNIPDECEEDCDGNGVPDDCDINEDPKIDCNGNDVPDSCDLANGTSLDNNNNNIPDECEVDCNNNGVPDDIDIAVGVSSDFNGNGVPDECDEDCNGNGISDEIDISLGDSSDDNFNGVPDECEVVVENKPPVAICQDITVPADANCAADATINNGSFDPDGDPITLDQSPPGPYPLGMSDVTLMVTDDKGASGTCSSTVTVEDREPPVIEGLSMSPNILWPPNHKMVLITPLITATDNCDSNLVVRLDSITMNEGDETDTFDLGYDSTQGDGHTYNDIEVDQSGNIYLRAERSGTGSGRIYTLTYVATDASGNSATASTIVTVPHNQ